MINNNKKELMHSERLEQSEQEKIAGGASCSLSDALGDVWTLGFIDKFIMGMECIGVPKGNIKVNDKSYMRYDENDPCNIDKIRVVMNVSNKCRVDDLSPELKQKLVEWGLLEK